MAYATLDDLKLRLGSNANPPGLYEQLTDRVALTTGNDAVGQEILAAAHGEVDGWLARRYAVPVDVSTDTALAARLKAATLTIAEKLAWETSPARKNMPPIVRDGYSDTIAWLKAAALGTASLPSATAIPAATADGPSAIAVGHKPVFTEDAMEGL